jgi:ubiquinone/menaquinone biosynthesis C-methylase UbiE
MQPDEYRKMAEVEDAMWYFRALHRHVGRSLRRVLPPTQARVLDAGCGTGGLLRRLREERPGWTLTGLDYSPLACGFASERLGSPVVQGSITELPFADAHFDAITSCDVVCQVAAPEQALHEFNRCLAPGGYVVLNMPAYQWMYSYHDRTTGNLRRYSRGEVNDLFRASGFRVVRSTYWNMFAFPLVVLRRKIMPPAAPSSDVGRFPAPVEAGFNALMAAEHAWLATGATLPFGNSVLTVAQKPQESAATPHS